jgi:sterol desaturase/sphingolipid hydroxylase (fatty acid hydroxylase superfamily)
MGKLKLLILPLGFLVGLILLIVATTPGHLQNLVSAHRGLGFYLLLAALLAIPARILVLAASYLLELALVGWSGSSLRMLWRPEASVKVDVLGIIMMILLPQRLLGYLLSFGLLYAIDAYTERVNMTLTGFLSTWGLQIGCFLLFQSFLRYWMHRLEHAVPALWALHKFHHSADRMTILTSARQTQLTKGVEAGVVLLPMGLLTTPISAIPGIGSPAFVFAAVYFAYHMVIQINGYLVHSNLTTDYGWLGRWLLVSPRMHRLHHAKAPDYHDKNFTFDLVIWDRLFGTYANCDSATAALAVPLGLDENPFNQRNTVGGALRDYFLTTYIVFWRELRKGSRAWLPGRDGSQLSTGAAGSN